MGAGLCIRGEQWERGVPRARHKAAFPQSRQTRALSVVLCHCWVESGHFYHRVSSLRLG